jgi:hypothetical protein
MLGPLGTGFGWLSPLQSEISGSPPLRPDASAGPQENVPRLWANVTALTTHTLRTFSFCRRPALFDYLPRSCAPPRNSVFCYSRATLAQQDVHTRRRILKVSRYNSDN